MLNRIEDSWRKIILQLNAEGEYQRISTVNQPAFLQRTFQHPTLPNIKTVTGKDKFRSSVNLQFSR
jgi:hypothetical protein